MIYAFTNSARPYVALCRTQLSLRESVIALTNRAVCLHKLGLFSEAVEAQERAIRLHLTHHAPALLEAVSVELIRQPCADLSSSMQLQTQLMNLAVYKLSLDNQDSAGLRLLMAWISSNLEYWRSPHLSQTLWDGSDTDQLIIWDDQGFGDILQNLGWIPEAARRVGSLRIWLRPALLPLVRACLPLPANCHLEALDPHSSPWGLGVFQIGSFFLPSSSNRVPQGPSRQSYFKATPGASSRL